MDNPMTVHNKARLRKDLAADMECHPPGNTRNHMGNPRPVRMVANLDSMGRHKAIPNNRTTGNPRFLVLLAVMVRHKVPNKAVMDRRKDLTKADREWVDQADSAVRVL